MQTGLLILVEAGGGLNLNELSGTETFAPLPARGHGAMDWRLAVTINDGYRNRRQFFLVQKQMKCGAGLQGLWLARSPAPSLSRL
jgi:hypothetical protein